MTETTRPPRSPRGRLNRIVNLAILATLVVLLLNPSGIIGRWLGSRYEGWKQRETIMRLWPELVDAGSVLPAGGATERERVVVEFTDYECPACRSVAESVSAHAVDAGVQVVIRHLPLDAIHPRAREAAAAAVCAERAGVFGRVHEMLMADEEWIAAPNWRELAIAVGANAGAFTACMSSDATRDRLLRDAALAGELGVVGTPTFVTRQGLFAGAGAFAEAVGGLPSAREFASPDRGDRTGTYVAGTVLFDSRDHQALPVSELALLADALFVEPDRVAVVDRRVIHFLDYMQPSLIASVGGSGGGPGEFRSTPQIVRAAHGVAAWDGRAARVTRFSVDGELLGTRKAGVGVGAPPASLILVAAFSDGAVVFRDGAVVPEGPDGEFRMPVRYAEDAPDGGVRVVAEAEGQEKLRGAEWGLFRSVDVVFGHDVVDAQLGEMLVIAQTDLDSIDVLDRQGSVAHRLPMPVAIPVSQAQRDDALAGNSSQDQALQRLGVGPVSGTQTPPTRDAAPGIDRMLVDTEGRLWLQRYRIPGASKAQWTVWDTEAKRVEMSVELDIGDTLLDAAGDRMILHRLGPFDESHFVIARLER